MSTISLYKVWITLFSALLIAGCSDSKERQAQGYVEGIFTYLSVPLSGRLQTLSVERGTQIKSGNSVFTLDPQPEQSQLENTQKLVLQAEAQVEQAKSALWLANQTLIRNQDLYKQRTVAKATLDDAQSQYDQTKARQTQAIDQHLAAKASLAQAQWAINQKTVVAPKNALVFDTYYRPGELVTAGQPIVSLLAPEDIKVIFYVSEPTLAMLKIGETVRISCDGCPTEKSLSAKIRFISPQNEYTPPVIFSTETRKKLVYRIEALPAPDNVIALRPGQPVTVNLR